MAKFEPITIKVGVSVSDKTIELCLKAIECWLEEDERRTISGGARHEDGTITPFKIEYDDIKRNLDK